MEEQRPVSSRRLRSCIDRINPTAVTIAPVPRSCGVCVQGHDAPTCPLEAAVRRS
jgi:hypothetical protein